MKILLTSFLLLLYSFSFSQELVFTFEDMAIPKFIEVADEGKKWVGLNHSKSDYLVFNDDFSLRASFPLEFDGDEDSMYDIQVVKYLRDDSEELLIAYSMLDDSAPWSQEIQFILADTTGETLIVFGLVTDFFWGMVGEKNAQLILDYDVVDRSYLYRKGDLDNFQNLDFKKVRFALLDGELSYYGFDYTNELIKWDKNFNQIWIRDVGIGPGANLTDIVHVSRTTFDNNEQLEWFVNTVQSLGGGNYTYRNLIFNEVGDELYSNANANTYYEIYEKDETGGYLVSKLNDHHTIYTLPGLEELGQFDADFIRLLQISETEFAWLRSDQPSLTVLNAELYIEQEHELVLLDTLEIPSDENHWFPRVVSVTRDFFDNDVDFEIVYYYRDPDFDSPDFGHNLSFTDENFQPFYHHTGRNIWLQYDACNEYKEFLINDVSTDSEFQAKYYQIGDLNREYISPFAIGNQVKYFPNPSHDWVELQWEDGTESIDFVVLFDSAGRRVLKNWSYNCSNNVARININKLAAGTYLAQIASGNQSESIRILKQ